ncbi:uncharacterized protein [Macrobrachium rosenbergii]|uniref:uncharacterized protein n=1 Tax=Macrobrachium rosenbergii TaxID=79674 RepID=UPI0034D678F0
MNGNLGRTREGTERVHGGWEVGERNDEGERVVDCALSFDLVIVGTCFEKKENQYITCKNGARENQIDFLMYRRSHLREVRNCRILNGECAAAQHRVVAMNLEIRNTVKGSPAHVPSTIKWWKLTQEEETKQEFKERTLRKVRLLEGVQEWWNHNIMVIKRVGGEVFGKTSGKKPTGDKETWWWNDEVKEVMKAKNRCKKDLGKVWTARV